MCRIGKHLRRHATRENLKTLAALGVLAVTLAALGAVILWRVTGRIGIG